MKLSLKPVKSRIYKAWLRSRLDHYSRNLHAIEVQRANDFHADVAPGGVDDEGEVAVVVMRLV